MNDTMAGARKLPEPILCVIVFELTSFDHELLVLNYKKISPNITLKFIKDFNNLLFQ